MTGSWADVIISLFLHDFKDSRVPPCVTPEHLVLYRSYVIFL